MSFFELLREVGFESYISSGKQALGSYSERVQCRNPRDLTVSIDLDAACKASQPNSPRWDYGIGVRSGENEQVEWIEIHPATSKEVESIIAKLQWLKTQIDAWQRDNPNCELVWKFHWLATKSVHLDQQKKRRLAGAGLNMPQTTLQVPSK